MSDYDVVIVGGGLGGSALGGYLANAGRKVLVLERLTEFSDRVRGEWMACWGVVELKKLGLYERFMAAGGHHLGRNIPYDELLTAAQSEAVATTFADLHPDVPGPLCMEHVVMQNQAIAWAAESGAEVLRGVSGVAVTAGASPRVRYTHEGVEHDVACRWIVGADGRGSSVRRQLEIPINEAPLDHLIAGLLVDGADDWPEDLQCIGKFGDLHYLVFPQGGGELRLYADYAYHGSARFSGPDGASEMLAAFDLPGVPHSGAVANARPIGPCRSYPSQDAWVDEPCVEGAVLVGDAAGYNDPILGQGLSVTLRDAYSVGTVLAEEPPYGVKGFAAYVEERRERLRRLRFAASFITTLYARFQPEDVERRAQAFKRMAGDPSLAVMPLAAFLGPEAVPAECFTPAFYERAFGSTEHMVA